MNKSNLFLTAGLFLLAVSSSIKHISIWDNTELLQGFLTGLSLTFMIFGMLFTTSVAVRLRKMKKSVFSKTIDRVRPQ